MEAHYRSNAILPTIRDNRRLCMYVAVWDQIATVHERNKPPFPEVIRRSAFRSSLQSGREISARLEHKPESTFAQRSTGELVLQEDDYGLFATTWLPANDTGNRIKADVEAGRYRGCSVGYNDVKDGRKKNGDLEEVIAADLFDVSLTQAPTWESTEVHLRHDAKLLNLFLRLRLLKLR